MMNPFDDIDDLESTSELPAFDTNETIFPEEPEEIKKEGSMSWEDEIRNEKVQPTMQFVFDEETAEQEDIKTSVGGNGGNVPPVNTPKSTKDKKPKKGTWKKEPTALNIIVTIATVILNALVIYVLFTTTKFSSVSKNIFLYVNIGCLIALLLIDLLVILMIRTKKIALFVINVIVVSLFVGAGGYASYALSRVNSNVKKITAETKEEEVSASLVIYTASSGDPITGVSDLEGKKVGISTGTTTAEIAQTRLSSEGVNVEYVEETGYTNVLSDLIAGNIDCAVLPVTYQSQFEDDENLAAYLTDTQSILDFSDTVTSTSEAGADKDITKEPFTVLVTGENQGLADTIILMSVNPISMKITMTSIARDSYVPISCYGSSDKINSAHASSESCMVQTVENLTGIDIDYTIEFNFASVIQVVDAVGGVDVDVPVSFYAQCWDVEKDELAVYYIEAGDNVHLDGNLALGFARERYAFSDGDFARQRHQQEIIEQVVEKLMASKDPQMFLDILDAAGDNIKTNFTVEQMTSFINYALQKAKRYYNQDSFSGLFNFESSRIYGYSAGLWNSSLDMELYIYRLFNGSISDCAAAIERNIDLDSSISTPAAVSWSAADEYTPDPVSQEWYNEAMITDTGKPAETETPEPTEEATEEPTVKPTEEPIVEPTTEPTVEPTLEPTIEPTTEPTDNTGAAEETVS